MSVVNDLNKRLAIPVICNLGIFFFNRSAGQQSPNALNRFLAGWLRRLFTGVQQQQRDSSKCNQFYHKTILEIKKDRPIPGNAAFYLGAILYSCNATNENTILGIHAASKGGKFPFTENTVEN